MANSRFYSNTAQQATLSGSVSSGATTVNVDATTGFPPPPYTLALDYGAATEELVSVTAVAGTTLTVVRGYAGTSAQSHSVGAVVRHVYNAQDATDFRTHEAATAAVHGVAGALVGTTDTQALTNKTLTSPTVNGATLNGGALSGTFSGDPNLTGSPTLASGSTLTWGSDVQLSRSSGASLSLNAAYQSSRTNPTDVTHTAILAGDAFDRWRVYADGKQEWGTGAASRDTNLFRDAANKLRTNDSLVVDLDLTSTNLTVTNVATINTLDVTTVTPGSSPITSVGLLTAATGWSVSSLTVGVLKAGFVTANLNVTRTGANITVNTNGTLSTGIVQMGTINDVYAPDSGLGLMYVHAGNSAGTGTARINATGTVELVKWQASQTISTGDTVSLTVTYPL